MIHFTHMPLKLFKNTSVVLGPCSYNICMRNSRESAKFLSSYRSNWRCFFSCGMFSVILTFYIRLLHYCYTVCRKIWVREPTTRPCYSTLSLLTTAQSTRRKSSHLFATSSTSARNQNHEHQLPTYYLCTRPQLSQCWQISAREVPILWSSRLFIVLKVLVTLRKNHQINKLLTHLLKPH